MTTKHRAEVLADWVKDTEFYDNPNPEINDRMDEVEPLLRTIPEMEAEIEALKEELKGWNLAWNEANPPLYDHPAKTLTDDEILQVAGEIPNLPGDWADHIVFARALLKKAGGK